MSKTILLNQNWIFSKEGHDEPVTLPHTWNAIDGQDGGNDYYRGTCSYTTVLPDIVLPENGRAVLQFDAVAMTAEVYLNEQKLAEHKGGYSAFCVDITDALRNGSNLLRVTVDNSDNDTVYPQKADFTFYGGIYRDVTLHVVPAAHFSLAENGAVPVKVTPIVTDLDARRCEVTVEAAVVGAESVAFTLDGQQTSVAVKDGTARAVFTLEHARLWDGLDDPYLYTVTARLVNGETETARFGCRKFEIDPQKGFILNGRPYPLRGVSRHQDRKGAGVAITREMMEEDMALILEMGANTIRLPFHYKLFTDEDYMGLTADQDGFARVDSLVEWCRESDLYLILDMHDAPGGQTGDNIDDSYGYPWLFDSEVSQQLYCDIWRRIADRYKNEPVILGYELFNEPIAPYFENMEELNGKLEDVYKKGVAAIREVDSNHIILLGGAQWNGNFKPFKDSKFDDKIMYTCHRYGGEPTQAAIQTIINFRDSVNLPMYMGEIGHNTDEWQAAFCQTMRENNIGYTFWPYKKMDGSSFVGITPPENWANIVYFSEAPRATYKEIREARPAQAMSRKAMMDFIEACKLKNCVVQEGYIRSLGMK
jgi:hypothetical protein